MIEAKKNKGFELIFDVYNKYILKRNFFKIHLLNNELFLERDKKLPAIIFANHSNWWDGLIAYYLSYNLWKCDAYMMMDLKQMKKYKFFKWIGAFSVNKSSNIDSVKSLNYSIELIKDTSKVLWIFPQGEMKHNDSRPINFQRGLIKILEKSGQVNLFALVFNYEYLMQQRPEVFIKLIPINYLNGSEPMDLDYLKNILTNNLNSQKSDIINERYDNYKEILKGKNSRNQIIDKLYDNN